MNTATLISEAKSYTNSKKGTVYAPALAIVAIIRIQEHVAFCEYKGERFITNVSNLKF